MEVIRPLRLDFLCRDHFAASDGILQRKSVGAFAGFAFTLGGKASANAEVISIGGRFAEKFTICADRLRERIFPPRHANERTTIHGSLKRALMHAEYARKLIERDWPIINHDGVPILLKRFDLRGSATPHATLHEKDPRYAKQITGLSVPR